MGQSVKATVESNATLHDTLEAMLDSSTGACCVVDKQGSLVGVVEVSHLTAAIKRLRDEARDHYDEIEAVA